MSELLWKVDRIFFFFLRFIIIIILAMMGLHCCTQVFSSCSEQGLLCVVELELLIVLASLTAEHGSRLVGCRGSVVVAHGLGCSVACEIFLGQGLNRCPLHCKADS